MIKSFAEKKTQQFWDTGKFKDLPPDLRRRALDKLQILNAANTIDVLRIPPGNRLEALKGDRKGFWSIRINDQWRLVFRFDTSDAFDVEIVDYH